MPLKLISATPPHAMAAIHSSVSPMLDEAWASSCAVAESMSSRYSPVPIIQSHCGISVT